MSKGIRVATTSEAGICLSPLGTLLLVVSLLWKLHLIGRTAAFRLVMDLVSPKSIFYSQTYLYISGVFEISLDIFESFIVFYFLKSKAEEDFINVYKDFFFLYKDFFCHDSFAGSKFSNLGLDPGHGLESRRNPS